MQPDLRTNPEAYVFNGASGLAHIDRDAFDEWSMAQEGLLPEDELTKAAERVGEHFAERLAATLSPPYAVHTTRHHRLVTALPGRRARSLLRVAERSVERIAAVLPALVPSDYHKYHRSLLHFESQDRYYDWVSDFDEREGPAAASSGMYLGVGIIACCGTDLFDLEAALAHELVHEALDGLGLPLWIEEGLAQLMEEAMGYSLMTDPVELLPKQRECWRTHGLKKLLQRGGVASSRRAQPVVVCLGADLDASDHFRLSPIVPELPSRG